MFTLNCKGKILVIDSAAVMGIINITPDSFYSGSRMKTTSDILSKAGKMITEGADIIDVGGQSTRPGSTIVPVEEELERVVPAIEAISREFPDQVISVDSFYSEVAKASIDAGAHIINDVSAGTIDTAMIDIASSLKVPYVLMHMPGTPETMKNASYTNVTLNVFDFFSFKINELKRAGIKDIIID
ncbi:MAG TPA: dihydropteroate synthase, partial [Flavisolibacter sp.]|nr:dihydropteroate synthase [Flavisolibacter sp.]